MKHKILLFLFAFATLLSGCGSDDEPQPTPIPEEKPTGEEAPTTMEPEVSGRVALTYAAYYRAGTPDPTYLTHINYAFAELYMQNGVYKQFGLQGTRERFEQVKRAKEQKPELKILISFTNSVSNSDNQKGGGFSALTKSAEMRKQFAEDCKQFLIDEGLDGIDLNWEFPGMTWGSTEYDTQADVDNYTLLMKDMREVLGNDFLLTFAGYCKDVRSTSDGGRRYIDIKAVEPYIDFVNVMTYDFDSAPDHHSALYSPNSYWDCKRTIDEYLKAGMPAEKIVLGIPFYGRSSFGSGGTISYKKIRTLSSKDGYKISQWDAASSAPYVTKNGVFYCGYDNPRSIAIKGDWARNLGLKGMMSWEYNLDDDQGTLSRSLWNAVMKQDE